MKTTLLREIKKLTKKCFVEPINSTEVELDALFEDVLLGVNLQWENNLKGPVMVCPVALLQAVTAYPDAPIKITDDSTLQIGHAVIKGTLAGPLGSATVADMKPIGEVKNIKILKKYLKFAGQPGTRYSLAVCHLEGTKLVATDGSRLVIAEGIGSMVEPVSIPIALARIVSAIGGQCEIKKKGDQVLLCSEIWSAIYKTPGPFPDYQQVLPTSWDYTCTLSADLLPWLKVIRKDARINFSVENKRLTFKAEGLAVADLTIDLPGIIDWDIRSIILRASLLREALCLAKRGERISMRWNITQEPVLIEFQDHRHVIMPMRP